MAVKVAINGFGRIGRNVLRAIFESGRNAEFDVVAVNDLGDAETNAHLTRFDTAHGPFPGEVEVDGASARSWRGRAVVLYGAQPEALEEHPIAHALARAGDASEVLLLSEQLQLLERGPAAAVAAVRDGVEARGEASRVGRAQRRARGGVRHEDGPGELMTRAG